MSIKDNNLLRQAANNFPSLIPQLQEVTPKNGRSMTHIDFPVDFLRRRASLQGTGELRNEYGRQTNSAFDLACSAVSNID